MTYDEPPSAKPHWPIVGALPSMIRDLSGFIQTNSLTQGDIYTIPVAGQKLVMLNHPQYVEHVKIRAKQKYHTGKGSPLTSLLFPDGILTTDGQRWRERRGPIQPYFNPPHLKTKLSEINDSIQRGLRLVDDAAETGEGSDLKTATSYLSMRVLIETIFGIEAEPEEMEQVRSALEFVITNTIQFIAQGNLPDWVPMPGRRQSKQAIQTFRDVAEKLVARQKASNVVENSLFNTLKNMSLPEQKQGDDRLISQILELLLAGYETTASTLFWIITLLIAHEDVLQKVTQEIDETLGTALLEQEDLIKLPYFKMVLSEVLRLFPTAYLFWLRCMEDDVINGYHISKGSRVVLSAYHIHRHPDFWDNPELFQPERFAPDTSKKRPINAFIPFGLGARKCLGNQFALVEIQLTIVRILQQYKLSFVSGYGVPKPVLGISLRPDQPVMISVSRRFFR